MIAQHNNGSQSNSPASGQGRLAPHHLQMLTEGSGIADEVVQGRGYTTSSGYQELRSLGLVFPSNTHTFGLLIPIFTPDGQRPMHFIAKTNSAVPLTVYRPDVPTVGKDGRERKYLLPYQALPRLNCHPRSVASMQDPTVPLWVTEGTKKCDCLISHGACALDIGGVWSWIGSNAQGGKSLALPDFRDVAWSGREVRLVFDSDIVNKSEVAYALRELTTYLESKGARVCVATLPSPQGDKVGVDDFLLSHTLGELEGLLQAPTTRPKTAKAAVTFHHTYKNGEPRPFLANVMEVLEKDPDWHRVVWYNAFAHKTELHNAPPGMPKQDWQCRTLRDTDEYHMTRVIQDRYELGVSSQTVGQAVALHASEHQYHPVREYLNSLRWDGIPRLDRWLPDLCHTDDNAYTRAVGAATLIGAVARIFDPGCHMDTLLILVGKQGLYKSATFRTLVGSSWFGDDMPRDLGHKDAKAYLRGLWLIEFSELSQFRRSEIEEIKTFVSTRVDKFRPAWGHLEQEIPRQCIFVGTSNRHDQFQDSTGNRRFWPVSVYGRCDLAGIEATRDMLWAEAVHRYRAGEPWYLTGDVLHMAEEEQRAHVAEDAWTEQVLEYVAERWDLLKAYLHRGRMVKRITVPDILAGALELEPLHQTPFAAHRVGAILRLAHWEEGRVENPAGQPRQLRGFLKACESPETPDSNPGDSSSSPQFCRAETPETPETPESLYTPRDTEKEKDDSLFQSSWGDIRKTPDSGVSGVSSTATPCQAGIYAETPDLSSGVSAVSETPTQAQAGEWCNIFSENGEQQNLQPFFISTVEAGPDGQAYARFYEQDGGWLLARCERTDPPHADASEESEPESEPVAPSSIRVGPTHDLPHITYVTEAAQLAAVLPELMTAPRLGLDTETTGLSWYRDKIRLVQVATAPDQVFVVDAFRCPLAPLAPVFARDISFVAHNAKFDALMLHAAGLPSPQRMVDTMLYGRLLGASASERASSELDDLANTYLGITLDKTHQTGPWDGALSEAMIQYSALDASVLLPLVDTLQAAIHTAEMDRVAQIEFACLPAMVWVELAGMPLDTVPWLAIAAEEKRDKEALEQVLQGLVDASGYTKPVPLTKKGSIRKGFDPQINWQSGPQVLAVLRHLGFAVDSIAQDALKMLKTDHPLVTTYLERVGKVEGTKRGAPWIEAFYREGRIYANWQQLGSTAGRMSCKEPNLQNIPRSKAYRSCFRAPDGHAIVKADFGQIELRLAAVIAGERQMLEAFRLGEDLHRTTAARVRGKDPAEVTPQERQIAKTVNFGLIYGLGAESLQAKVYDEAGITISIAEADTFRQAFFALYLGFRRWHAGLRRQIQQHGSIETRTLAGRRRLGVRSYTEGANSPVQGSAADGFKLALAQLYQDRQRHPEARVIGVVHDEILLECPAPAAHEVRGWVKCHMEDAMHEVVEGNVPIVADVTVGRDWAGTPL